MSECQKFRVEGRVQGVWFRESTRKRAEDLGISGHAINRDDGSVEILACGDSDAVDKLADWLREGPPMAKVDSVTAESYSGPCPEGFETG